MTITTQQSVSGANTVDAPAVTANGSDYVLAWRAADASIWWTMFPASNEKNTTRYDFGQHKNVAGIASSGGPALTTFKSKAWMAWKGEGTDTRIFLSSLSGSSWGRATPVPAVGTQSSPALTATGSELFLTFMGEHDKTIYCAKSTDGVTWGAAAPVPGAASSDTPASASFGDTVYLAWKGESDHTIWLNKYDSANGWGKAEALPSNFDTSNGPALGFGSTGNIHLVWKGASDKNVWESFRGSSSPTWDPQKKISVVATSARPALATQTRSSDANQVLLAWKGGSDDSLWVGPIDDLQATIPAPPPPPNPARRTYSWPVTGFGSGPNRANFSCTLDLNSDGKATFSGQYTDSGTLPVVAAPSQDYAVAVAVVGSNKVPYTFSHSGGPVATGGAQDLWNETQTSAVIQQNWSALQGAQAWAHCSNNSDLGSVLDGIIQDIKTVVGVVEAAVAIIG